MIHLILFYILSLLLTAVCNKRNLKIVYLLITFGVSILSFFYVPNESADLYRHFETISFYGDMGFDWVIENRTSLDPLAHMLWYAFSLIDDVRFVSSFYTFVTYGFSLLLLYRVSKFYSLRKADRVILTVFLLFNWNYLLVASSGRIFMLYAIVAFFFYMEFVEDRYHKIAFVVYVASCLFHYGILLVVLPRLFMYLYKPANKIVYLWALFIVVLFVYVGVSNYETIFLESVIGRAEEYKKYNVFGIWQYLNSLACVMVPCFYVIKRRALLVDIKRYCTLYWIAIVVIIFYLSNYQVLYRESNLIASLSIVLFSRILNLKNDHTMKLIIGLQSIITLVYSLVYVYSYMDFMFVI